MSIFRFHLQQTNGSLSFLFSVRRKQPEVAVFSLVLFPICRILETWSHGHEAIKWKTRARAIFLNPFTHHANRSLLFVCLFTKKQIEVIHL
jgi:hypothetical protein